MKVFLNKHLVKIFILLLAFNAAVTIILIGGKIIPAGIVGMLSWASPVNIFLQGFMLFITAFMVLFKVMYNTDTYRWSLFFLVITFLWFSILICFGIIKFKHIGP